MSTNKRLYFNFLHAVVKVPCGKRVLCHCFSLFKKILPAARTTVQNPKPKKQDKSQHPLVYRLSIRLHRDWNLITQQLQLRSFMSFCWICQVQMDPKLSWLQQIGQSSTVQGTSFNPGGTLSFYRTLVENRCSKRNYAELQCSD